MFFFGLCSPKKGLAWELRGDCAESPWAIQTHQWEILESLGMAEQLKQ